MRLTRSGRSVLLVALAIGITSALSAAALGVSQSVAMRSFAFAPPNATIVAGETITWQNFDPAAHTATSDTGVFDTGTIATGGSRTITFATAGTYGYHCAIHSAMTGTITVQSRAATAPPTPVPTVPRTPAATAPPTPAPTGAPTEAATAAPSVTAPASLSPPPTIEPVTERPSAGTPASPSATAPARPTGTAAAEPGPVAIVGVVAVGVAALAGLVVLLYRRR